METNTYTYFENTSGAVDTFEIHAPNCACIKKYLNQMVIDTASIHNIQAVSALEAQAEIDAEFGYGDDDDEKLAIKIFPCTKNVGK